MEQPKEYHAFISYKREDIKEAKRLQNALEYYRLPNHLRQNNPELPEYVRPVFRDMTDLEVGELSALIHEGLEQSHFLIVVCSPRSATSKWVNDEVDYFISLGKQDKIIPYIIEGVPHASNPDEECYPPALLSLSKEKELLGANINEVGRGSATIRVVSRMFNIRFDTLYQRYQREQMKHRRRIVATIVLAFLFLSGITGWIWHQNVLLEERNWKMMENQARAVVEKADRLIDEGDSYLAQRLLLEILPLKPSQPTDRPYIVESEGVLRKALNRNTTILRGHTSNVESVSFSPDGRFLVSASMDGTMRVWNVNTGECVKLLVGHSGWVNSACFSPDGKYIVSASEDNTIRIWDFPSGNCIDTLKGHTESVYTVAISKDGEKLISASWDGTVRIWNLSTKQCILQLKEDGLVVTSAQFSPDGKYYVSGSIAKSSNSKTLQVRNAKTGMIVTVFELLGKDVHSTFFSPDGTKIASISSDKTFRIWDAFTGKCLFKCEVSFAGTGAFHPDGNHVAIPLSNDEISIIDVTSGECQQTFVGHTETVTSIAFSPDGKYLASASHDYTARIWGTSIGQRLNNLEPNSKCDMAEISSDGKLIVSKLSDHSLRIWSVDTRECIQTLEGYYLNVYSADFSLDGKYAVTVSDDKIIHLWDVATGKCLRSMKGHSFAVKSVAFSHDGKYVVSASSDRTVRLWDSKSGRCLQIMQGHKAWVESAVFSPDDNYIVSTSWNNDIRLWEVATGLCIKTMKGHTGTVFSANYSPDGTRIVSSSNDRTVRIWDVVTGQCVDSLKGHSNSVIFAKYSHDGKHIVSKAYDNSVRVWDALSTQCLLSLKYAQSVAFTSDCKNIVLLYNDGTVYKQDFLPLQFLVDKTRERFLDRPLTPDERKQYYLE